MEQVQQGMSYNLEIVAKPDEVAKLKQTILFANDSVVDELRGVDYDRNFAVLVYSRTSFIGGPGLSNFRTERKGNIFTLRASADKATATSASREDVSDASRFYVITVPKESKDGAAGQQVMVRLDVDGKPAGVDIYGAP